MKEFYPWASIVYQDAIAKYKAGHFSILDIQLSGKCNYNCVYCDSPDRGLAVNIDFGHLEQLVRQEDGMCNWMFVCGLGEPLWGDNKISLLRLLQLCKELGIKCSIFTNGSNVDDRILRFIQEGILYPVIKIDTFDLDLSKELYGYQHAQKTLDAIDVLFAIARESKSNYCSVAASIVPTTKNLREIPVIVKRCVDNQTFPLLGQLEYAGKAINSYDDLLLSKEQLLVLKNRISTDIKSEYRIPICPSVISGMHISSSGYVSVDKKSGLSCSWFWMETPDTVNICNINELTSLQDAGNRIIEYRKKMIPYMIENRSKIEEQPFGGCGGNIIDLVSDYIEIQSNIS
jgi:MoaA/NifB/PqqE/SkfB family radical SAM enzyme